MSLDVMSLGAMWESQISILMIIVFHFKLQNIMQGFKHDLTKREEENLIKNV
jgi:hypothetical protein